MAEEKKTEEQKTETKQPAVRKERTGRALRPFEEMQRMFEEFFPRRWMSPWQPGWSPSEEMERMFEELSPRRWMSPFRREWPTLPELTAPFEMRTPRVDVMDREEDILVRAEIPGVKKEDLDISMSDDAITIRGSTTHEEKEETGDYYRCEISRGGFVRTVSLPAAVDGTKAKAKFTDGILEVTAPIVCVI